ncbi:hypothetical protein F2Q69_00045866 [Brassica cretica]|uniref:Uncharacterized protein n=1 Tax=Brassica cretica TaxID=69181 RepID=A0A8S9N5I3_BRACR|nr:hypothetical protein F2Q69_00045866 [Brassica cretica]
MEGLPQPPSLRLLFPGDGDSLSSASLSMKAFGGFGSAGVVVVGSGYRLKISVGRNCDDEVVVFERLARRRGKGFGCGGQVATAMARRFPS